jgi:hypothetical protein
MDTGSLVLAYAAVLSVAAVVTVAFAPAINRVLDHLVPAEIAPAWSQFVKFALFVAAFAGGMPAPAPGAFVDRNGPIVTPPVEGEGLMLVMRSIGGALAAASWLLLVFFAVTLTASMAGRVWLGIRQRREAEARALESREQERLEAKAKQEGAEASADAPLRRQEPAEARPVRRESSGTTQPPQRR